MTAEIAFFRPSKDLDSIPLSFPSLCLLSASTLCLSFDFLSSLSISVSVFKIESKVLLIFSKGSDFLETFAVFSVTSFTDTCSTRGFLKSFSAVIFPAGGAFTIAEVLKGLPGPPGPPIGSPGEGGAADVLVVFSLIVNLAPRSFIFQTLLSSFSRRSCSSNGSSFPANL